MNALVKKHKKKAGISLSLIATMIIGIFVGIFAFGAATVITSPTPVAPQSPITVLDPSKVVQDLPSSPDRYNTSSGASSAPAVPNGNLAADPITAPPSANTDTTVVTGGFGGAPLAYAKQSTKGNQPRFSPEQAVAVAINESKTHQSGRDWSGLCEGFAGSYTYGWAYSGQYSAKTAFYAYPSTYRHKITSSNLTKVPAGAVVYWTEGTYGHATLSIGNGKVASTDILRQGLVDLVPIQLIADHWMGGDLGYWVDPVWFSMAGGSSGLKAPVVATPVVPVNPVPIIPVQPTRVKPATAKYPGHPIKPGQRGLYVSDLKYAFKWPNISKSYGKAFKVRVIKWQRNHPAFGKADGIVGPITYKRLTGHK